MKLTKALASLLFFIGFGLLNFTLTGCNYKFSETGTIDPNVKTVKVNLIQNVATYINPQLSPNLTEKLRQKINNQTKLSLTNSDNAHWIIDGQITDYNFSTVGVTSNDGKSETSINRLTITVRIMLTRQIENKEPEEYTATRQIDFKANLSQQEAESKNLDEIVRNLTDEIFNRLFSNW